MRINVKFRNLESSEGIKNYASEKVSRLQKYLRAPLDAELTVSLERHVHIVDLIMTSGGQRYAAREESENMYTSIDMVIDKIDRQVRDMKAAHTDKKRHSSEGLHLGKNG